MGRNILTHFYPLFLVPSLLYLINVPTMILVTSQNILINFDIEIHKWLATHQIPIFCCRKIIFPSLFLKFNIIYCIVDIFDHTVSFALGLCSPWRFVIPILSWKIFPRELILIYLLTYIGIENGVITPTILICSPKYALLKLACQDTTCPVSTFNVNGLFVIFLLPNSSNIGLFETLPCYCIA